VREHPAITIRRERSRKLRPIRALLGAQPARVAGRELPEDGIEVDANPFDFHGIVTRMDRGRGDTNGRDDQGGDSQATRQTHEAPDL
jgi:hypothetical protein